MSQVFDIGPGFHFRKSTNLCLKRKGNFVIIL